VQPNNNVLIVDTRHNGPPSSGNGGWTSGLIAAFVTEGIPEVTLHKPPPLGVPLIVVPAAEGLRVIDPSDTVIATARSRQADIEPVPPVTLAGAAEAASRYPGHGTHHFPTCFVCGPLRPDGLRIFPGHLAEGRGTAAVFEVPEGVDPVMIWAALDCPGGWTVITGDHPWVLGRMAVAIDELPKPGERGVVVGREVHRDGRKALVRTTLYREGGGTSARAEATWIALPPV
jgi:hypothetical protein